MSPDGRSLSANAWDVFRSENLVLEGFTNVPHNKVLEVPPGICSFAFLPPFSHTSATLQTDEPCFQHCRHGPTIDPNLKNPWGLTAALAAPAAPAAPGGLAITTPGPRASSAATGAPATFSTEAGGAPGNFVIVPPPGLRTRGNAVHSNWCGINGSPADFLLDKAHRQENQAVFIFATEDGTISGWNPAVNIPAGGKPLRSTPCLEVDNSDKGSGNGAVYKGMTSGEIDGHRFLYVTNFRKARIEVYDTNFKPVHLGDDAFDPDGD